VKFVIERFILRGAKFSIHEFEQTLEWQFKTESGQALELRDEERVWIRGYLNGHPALSRVPPAAGSSNELWGPGKSKFAGSEAAH
jgi:hypothetical protein